MLVVFLVKENAREAVPRASGNKISTLDEWRQLVAGADAHQLLRLKPMGFDKMVPRLATCIGPMHFCLTPVKRFVRLAENDKKYINFSLFQLRRLPTTKMIVLNAKITTLCHIGGQGPDETDFA